MHMVIYRSLDGNPSYHQAEELDGAVKFVERLRNEDHVTDARIFQMAEVAIEFKTYYRVEVTAPVPSRASETEARSDPSRESEAFSPLTTPADDAPAHPVPPLEPSLGMTGEMTGPTPVPAGTSGRFGLFGRT